MNSMNHRKRMLAVAAVLLAAVTLAGTCAMAGPAARPEAGAADTVSVNGSAVVTRKPDIAVVTFGTVSQAADASAARDANSKLMAGVMQAVKAAGVDDKDIKTTSFSMSPVYDADGKKITAYQVNNSIQVKVRKLDRLGALLDAATAAGANYANGLYFDVEDSEAAYNQALAKAVENARQRAETLAKSAGRTLGAVISAGESGGYNPYPIYFGRETMAADGGVPVSGGTLDVSAAVSVTFELR